MHGNNIPKLKEANKLAGLTDLRTLTLHGNPLAQAQDYRRSTRGNEKEKLKQKEIGHSLAKETICPVSFPFKAPSLWICLATL
jgi:hypothetical protein